MKEAEGSIEINATTERAWKVLTDLSSYPEWNPFMVSMVGKLEVGQVCTATVRMAGRKEVVFPTRLVDMTEGREMVFRGTPKKGLVSDDHYFTLTPLEGGRTRFSQRVAYSGIMSPFIGGVVYDTGRAIEAMNQAYKVRCEGK